PTAAAFGGSGSTAGGAQRAPGRFRERLAIPKPKDEKRSDPNRGLRHRCRGLARLSRDPDRAGVDETAKLLIPFRLDISAMTRHSASSLKRGYPMNVSDGIALGLATSFGLLLCGGMA